jgi:hypothetical protein
MRWNSINPKDAALAVGLAFALVMTGTPTVSADDDGPKVCSNRTLRGDYGFTISGTIFPPSPAPSFLVRGVAMTRFDGRGNLSQVDFATRNGVPFGSDWRPATGSYDLNADCTGTAEINPNDGSPTLHLRMVVVDGGRQIFNTVEGNATNAIGIKVR